MKNTRKVDLATAEFALDSFLDSWLQEDWGRMSKSCQKTWRTVNKKPARTLKMLFGSQPICLYEIKGEREVKELNSATIVDIIFEVTLKGDNHPRRYVARIVKERKSLTPDAENGTWGVNLPSALRGVG